MFPNILSNKFIIRFCNYDRSEQLSISELIQEYFQVEQKLTIFDKKNFLKYQIKKKSKK